MGTTETTVTIVIPEGADERDTDYRDIDQDAIYIHGARIADPENDVNVTWDLDEDPAAPVYVTYCERSEDEAPYRAAIEALGIEITAKTADGYAGIQTRTL